MLQELVRETGAAGWAVASMLLFLALWLVLALRVFRARPEEMAALARLPLSRDGEDDPAAGAGPRD